MFTDKLNKKPKGTYSIVEKITLKDNRYIGALQHDNIIKNSLMVYDNESMAGEQIETYTLSTTADKPWETIINITTEKAIVYLFYESQGDTVDADDINNLQNAIKNIDTSDIEKQIKDLQDNKSDTVYVDEKVKLINQQISLLDKNKANQTEIERLELMIKEIVEQELDKMATKIEVESITGDLNDLTTKDKVDLVEAINEVNNTKLKAKGLTWGDLLGK